MKTFVLSMMLVLFPFSENKAQTKIFPSEISRQFMLLEMPGFTCDQLIEARSEIDLTLLSTSGIYIYGDTTYIPVRLIKSKQICFLVTNKRQKTYDNKSKLIKTKLMSLLPTINSYKTEGHFIFLYSDKKMVFKAIAKDWD